MKAPPRPDVWSSTEVTRLLGITYRQVDYWVREGLLRTALPVEGTGRPRHFDHGELVIAAALAALSAAGVTGDLLRAVSVAMRAGQPAARLDGATVHFCPEALVVEVPLRLPRHTPAVRS